MPAGNARKPVTCGCRSPIVGAVEQAAEYPDHDLILCAGNGLVRRTLLGRLSAMGIRPEDTQLGLIPLSHAYGLGSLVVPLFLQGTAVVLRESFVPNHVPEDATAFGARVFPGVRRGPPTRGRSDGCCRQA